MMTPIRANNKASLGSMVYVLGHSLFAAPVASKHRGELLPSKKQTNGKSWANAVRIYGRAFHIFVISNAGFLNR